ncbi:MAG TPA: IgGFc-binding protein [Candidatus Kapabacteria bacterium]
MKKFISAFLILIAIANVTRAQFSAAVTSQPHDLNFSAGRDFWLAEMSNQWGDPSQQPSQTISITSPRNTVAHIQYAGQTYTDSIKENLSVTISIPLSMQLESSGIVENKSIHIWSEDAPLIIYNMNRLRYSSDGEYVIPTIGWDTEYVVAGYGAPYPDSPDDYPSECAIVADQDSTIIQITPSCNCRQATSGNVAGDTAASIVVFPKGVVKTFTMNKGQTLQLLSVLATNPDGFDLTGTIIHSNKSIGVFGGSSFPRIPNNFPYRDHIEDMMPPVRTWGTSYMGTAFAAPAGQHTYHA